MKTSFSYIGKCPAKGCQTVFKLTVPATITNHTRNVNYCPGANNPPIYETFQKSAPAWRPYCLYIHCAGHKRELVWREVCGTLNPDHACDARCMNATGPNCECSCGGANHGGKFQINY